MLLYLVLVVSGILQNKAICYAQTDTVSVHVSVTVCMYPEKHPYLQLYVQCHPLNLLLVNRPIRLLCCNFLARIYQYEEGMRIVPTAKFAICHVFFLH